MRKTESGHPDAQALEVSPALDDAGEQNLLGFIAEDLDQPLRTVPADRQDQRGRGLERRNRGETKRLHKTFGPPPAAGACARAGPGPPGDQLLRDEATLAAVVAALDAQAPDALLAYGPP